MANFVYLSKERLHELEHELKDLKTEGRKGVAERIAEARSHGDLSENAEYDAAKEEQGLLELKISKLEEMLSKASIIDTSNMNHEEVHILSRVKVRNLGTQKDFEYQIVSQEEADLQKGKIAINSPVGNSLVGKKVGEKVSVKAPAGTLNFEILAIS
ncbi:MAG: transcription elongation factor GreA [Melioribacteraceae bacterium]|nr:transcription elongation factor GreA [Melioribacteraceae bacterium]MCF8265540.1 transcription elongation factor GreA [Melioribacteraceae bacterium]MCF8414193.1 transcription elongation factor GreA [Melioribacteraceae bacterium]MCF8432403.1 transcription elongation factor GreA [Melioribacteraceae bacterium]